MENLKNENTEKLRIIKTARDQETINQGVKNGFTPIVKKVVPSNAISSKYQVLQDRTTGEISVIGDYRAGLQCSNKDYKILINWSSYYPYQFKSPFAAYLIPKDIEIGERVYLEDLIEDIVGSSWNQGDTYRLEGAEAVWNGTDLEIQYDPFTNCSNFMG